MQNAPLLAVMALVTNNKVTRSLMDIAKMNGFKATAAFIVSHYLVVIKRKNKRGLAHIHPKMLMSHQTKQKS